MLLPITAIIIGLVFLVWSADRFVIGASSTAKNLGMSPLLIGLTIVSLGTSAPEIFVSIISALDGSPGLAVGNALGSNIANVGLILGITALWAPLPIRKRVVKKELPILLAVTALAGLLLIDLNLTQVDGWILIAGLVLTLWLLIAAQTSPANEQQSEPEEIEDLPSSHAIFWLIAGLVVLIISARAIVWGATEMALLWGVSELIIGLTIVAIGTSLPELAASLMSAIKGHHDIAIGNVIGSNIFNLLAVMSIASIIKPIEIDEITLWRDYGVMAGFTLALAVFSWIALKRSGYFSRFKGLLLLICYVAYMSNLAYFTMQAQ